ncbi:hypothetical protein [Bacillus cereus]|uniref:Uncharacterized protein n=1 Tax=Bacillus cereus TaxID=1396 RepID=A0A2B9E2R0_BACCE|nr:hypothetical protein [Bacillus cereus]PGM94532.1 hypothetical protein CN958_10735 [Bacillus cereus]
MKDTVERQELVHKENERLKKLFQDIPPRKLKVVEGLIVQAARLRVSLNEMWKDLSENGDYEMFSQSDKTEPYERERPVARLYNTRDQSYQRIMKQLTELLPEERNTKEVKKYVASDLI